MPELAQEDVVCGKSHCYSNGYEEGSGGWVPYSWVVNLLDACP